MGRWGQKGEANSGVEKDRARAIRMRQLEGALGVRARRGAGAGDRRRPAETGESRRRPRRNSRAQRAAGTPDREPRGEAILLHVATARDICVSA